MTTVHEEIETHEDISYRIRIEQHDGALDPRKDFDNVGTMVCWHRRYNLGDEQRRDDSSEWLDALIAEHGEANLVVLPLYLYDHSGITMKTTSFSCSWDSGQVGYIYVTKAKALLELSCHDDNWREVATKCLVAEVTVYDNYLTGNVHGYVIARRIGENGKWEELDSCWGCFGDYDEDVLKEAKSIVKHYVDKQVSLVKRVIGEGI